VRCFYSEHRALYIFICTIAFTF